MILTHRSHHTATPAIPAGADLSPISRSSSLWDRGLRSLHRLAAVGTLLSLVLTLPAFSYAMAELHRPAASPPEQDPSSEASAGGAPAGPFDPASCLARVRVLAPPSTDPASSTDAPSSPTWLSIRAEPALLPGADAAKADPASPVDLSARLPADGRVIILVHGLDEPGSIFDDLAGTLAPHGIPVLRFDYPNDQHIHASAELLAATLGHLHTLGVRRVDFVAHSMGGLVCREALTHPDAIPALDPASIPLIDRLIMLGTPHAGSPWARLQGVAEFREHVMRALSPRSDITFSISAFMHDGRGEAATDLRPGSAFLERLNERPDPKGVAITNIVASVSRDQAGPLDAALRSPAILRVLGIDTSSLANNVDSTLNLLGDGVVPVNSAALPRFTDTVRLQASHRTMIRRFEVQKRIGAAVGTPPAPAPAIAVVLDRLGLVPLQPPPMPPSDPPTPPSPTDPPPSAAPSADNTASPP